jgi:hypothetical protein
MVNHLTIQNKEHLLKILKKSLDSETLIYRPKCIQIDIFINCLLLIKTNTKII